MSKKTIIIGVGNTLRHDDGIGPAVIQLLINSDIINKAAILDGGTDGLALIDYIKEYEKVIIVDAVNMGLCPGEIKVFSLDEVVVNVSTDSLSTHGFGLADVFNLLNVLEIKRNIKIIGIQPEDVSIGNGLSNSVMKNVDNIISIVKDIV